MAVDSMPTARPVMMFVADPDEQGRPRRVTHYLFDSDNELDEYLAGPAVSMRPVATSS